MLIIHRSPLLPAEEEVFEKDGSYDITITLCLQTPSRSLHPLPLSATPWKCWNLMTPVYPGCQIYVLGACQFEGQAIMARTHALDF